MLPAGVITGWNKGAQKLYGYSPNEIVGEPISILFPADGKRELRQAHGHLKLGKLFRIDTVQLKKDGSLIHVRLSASPLGQESGAALGSTILVQGVTEAEDMFGGLLSSSPIGMYIVQDGLLKFISPQFGKILGYEEIEIINTESLSYVYPEDRNGVRQNAIEALKNGFYKPYEYRIRTKSGDIKWTLETVISIIYRGKRATLGNFMDITERKQAQEEMRLANDKLVVMVKKFEKQNELNTILTDMRDLLQACSTIKETVPIIVGAMKKLFPHAEGALYLTSPSRTDLESVARWGGFPEDVDENVFTPSTCWGLRRGKVHIIEENETGPICGHMHKVQVPYACLPLIAKGDVLGLLHLRAISALTDPDKQQLINDMKDIGIRLSEYLSLAIANIKLGEILSMQSIQDPLSGLYNRRFMEETVQREILRATRRRSQIGIIMADIDNFKLFNDTYGHTAGDMCISHLGKFFKQRIRGSDIACRYGGEEFILILPESLPRDTLKRAEILRQEVKKLEFIFQGQFIGSITISLGVASYPANGTTLDELLRSVDKALYQAKQGGRDRVVATEAE